jgi:hypothetical protein
VVIKLKDFGVSFWHPPPTRLKPPKSANEIQVKYGIKLSNQTPDCLMARMVPLKP